MQRSTKSFQVNQVHLKCFQEKLATEPDASSIPYTRFQGNTFNVCGILAATKWFRAQSVDTLLIVRRAHALIQR